MARTSACVMRLIKGNNFMPFERPSMVAQHPSSGWTCDGKAGTGQQSRCCIGMCKCCERMDAQEQPFAGGTKSLSEKALQATFFQFTWETGIETSVTQRWHA